MPNPDENVVLNLAIRQKAVLERERQKLVTNLQHHKDIITEEEHQLGIIDHDLASIEAWMQAQ